MECIFWDFKNIYNDNILIIENKINLNIKAFKFIYLLKTLNIYF